MYWKRLDYWHDGRLSISNECQLMEASHKSRCGRKDIIQGQCNVNVHVIKVSIRLSAQLDTPVSRNTPRDAAIKGTHKPANASVPPP
jgi:hypothetical protein